MPQLRDESYLVDIIEAAKLIFDFVAGLDKKDFFENLLVQSAVIRQLEIIGEGVKRLSPELRDQYSNIPWRQMAGMRDVLIHSYDHVDISEVWNVSTIILPQLLPIIQGIASSCRTIPST